MYNLFMKRGSSFNYFYFPVLLLLVLSLTGCGIFKSDGSDENTQQEEEKPTERPPENYWFKGNLHAHSYWTDGNDYPEMIMNWYKEQGYNFAVVSEHNNIHGGERNIEVANQDDEYFLQRYLDEFGDGWVENKESDGVTTVNLKGYDEYSSKVRADKFLAIRAEEIDYRDTDNPDNNGDRLIHVNVINVQKLIDPPAGGSTAKIIQEMLEAGEQQSNQQNKPMIAIINHPNIRQSISPADLKQVNGARFFEVYNGHPNANNDGHSSLPSTEELWDKVLTNYILNDEELLYGVAGDDSHGYNFNNAITPESNLPGRGWIQVKAEELTTESILSAMNKGNFYASTGVELSDVTFEDGTLKVNVNRESGVSYTIQFIGTKSDQTDNTGVVLAEKNGIKASYTLKENDLYVRAKIISDKPKENASSSSEVEVAWVQPVTQ